MNSDRRTVLKQLAAAAAITAAEGLMPGVIFAAQPVAAPKDLTWRKAPCRFCGVGCGVLIGVKSGSVTCLNCCQRVAPSIAEAS